MSKLSMTNHMLCLSACSKGELLGFSHPLILVHQPHVTF